MAVEHFGSSMLRGHKKWKGEKLFFFYNSRDLSTAHSLHTGWNILHRWSLSTQTESCSPFWIVFVIYESMLKSSVVHLSLYLSMTKAWETLTLPISHRLWVLWSWNLVPVWYLRRAFWKPQFKWPFSKVRVTRVHGKIKQKWILTISQTSSMRVKKVSTSIVCVTRPFWSYWLEWPWLVLKSQGCMETGRKYIFGHYSKTAYYTHEI